MDKDYRKKFNLEETKLADQVADELLTIEEEDNRRYFILILLFSVCLVFLVSSLSFAVFDTYFNGSWDNATDVHINVDEDIDVNKNDDEGKDEDKDKDDVSLDDKTDKDEFVSDVIDSGKIYFSYNTGSNYIKMDSVYPMSDDLGKALAGEKQYFDFNIKSLFQKKKNKKLVYEVSIVPIEGNTIPGDEVRVYLTENNKGVSVLESDVNNFSDLPDSRFQKNGKVIYKKEINGNYSADYVFRMWLSYNSDVTKEVRKFGCKIAVDAYSLN